MRDKGTPSSATRPISGPVRLTAPIPANLSPLVRPSPYTSNGHSPRPHSNSSASSDSSSPLHSPSTNPSGSDSPHPRKESFNFLPPPAYNLPQSFGFPGSMPVKIPALIPQPSPVPSTPALPIGAASVETLRFGRKSGIVNSVTSPNALTPRCACGKPAGHRQSPEERAAAALGIDNSLSHLSLASYQKTAQRNASDSSVNSPSAAIPASSRGHAKKQSGYGNRLHASGSLLSRSRSDPIPPSPTSHRAYLASMADRDATTRRASQAAPERPLGVFDAPIAPSRGSTLSPRRGRSRERQHHVIDPSDKITSRLNHPPEREHPPPSRSQIRNENRRSNEEREAQCEVARLEREKERMQRFEQGVISPNAVVSPSILPSWSRCTTDEGQGQSIEAGGAGAPGSGMVSRRPGSGSPKPKSPLAAEGEERRRAERGGVNGVVNSYR